MKNYEITVNGKVYQVSVKEVDAEAPLPRQNQTVAPVQQTPSQPQNATQSSDEKITAPMPGTILRVQATEGQTVVAGEVLCILEAMKMENEIVAPTDGIVSNIQVGANQPVESGDLLLVIS
ncbi:biotin/lipoyl-binding protein [Desemzia sp. RIT804]|uniref:biotin/lipoyl-containing protein n=1 Tax=Desemzia sp. RIT 804 TaxID=2810209 RepID=UPI00194F5DA5|nr:biotin/lipoyl-containing protein [Desemzia sp. RIT 804]MBM6614260.1 biotin/lipoyl-binding protein [Desemzia sp. RIT 804]